MANVSEQGRTAAPETASSKAEQAQRVALRAQGLKKRNDEEVAHIVLAPKILPETPDMFRMRHEGDKLRSRLDPSKA